MIFSLRDPADCQMLTQAIQGKNVGLTSGTYDLFHYLHLVYLEKCRRLCDLLIVGVDSDRLVKATKGSDRPIIPEPQRLMMLQAIRYVDAVFVMDSTDDFLLAAKLFAKVLFKNDAFKPEDVLGKEYAPVVIIPDVRIPDSTTAIVEECIRRRTKELTPQFCRRHVPLCAHCGKPTLGLGMVLGKDMPFCDEACHQVYLDNLNKLSKP